MPRIVWLTDIHLNFVSDERMATFLVQVRDAEPDLILVSGDIGEAHSIVTYLQLLDNTWQIPLFFVLGNHDFYFGSIDGVRSEVSQLCAHRDNLTYLSEQPQPCRISNVTGLVGHDGWADARLGDYERSTVMLNDYRLIEELSRMTKQDRLAQLQALGDEAAHHIRQTLPAALEEYDDVYLVTHVPPWREACWYDGRTSNDEWAPHFSCHAVGQAIEDIMCRCPEKQLTVLCGHTHGEGFVMPRDNVKVYTGGAVYREPAVTRIFASVL